MAHYELCFPSIIHICPLLGARCTHFWAWCTCFRKGKSVITSGPLALRPSCPSTVELTRWVGEFLASAPGTGTCSDASQSRGGTCRWRWTVQIYPVTPKLTSSPPQPPLPTCRDTWPCPARPCWEGKRDRGEGTAGCKETNGRTVVAFVLWCHGRQVAIETVSHKVRRIYHLDLDRKSWVTLPCTMHSFQNGKLEQQLRLVDLSLLSCYTKDHH